MVTVGISDCGVANCDDVRISTHALGSCIAVAVYDPRARVAGLLHFMLPDGSQDIERARARPFMYADSGIPLLFHRCYELGAVKQRMRVALLGGARLLDDRDTFQIGKRNHLAARRILWKAGVMVRHEEVGGTLPRTVHLDVGTGRLAIQQALTLRELWLNE